MTTGTKATERENDDVSLVHAGPTMRVPVHHLYIPLPYDAKDLYLNELHNIRLQAM